MHFIHKKLLAPPRTHRALFMHILLCACRSLGPFTWTCCHPAFSNAWNRPLWKSVSARHPCCRTRHLSCFYLPCLQCRPGINILAGVMAVCYHVDPLLVPKLARQTEPPMPHCQYIPLTWSYNHMDFVKVPCQKQACLQSRRFAPAESTLSP